MITSFKLLNCQCHVQLLVFSIRHNQQVFMPFICRVTVHVMDDFTGFQPSTDVCLGDLTTPSGICCATVCHTAERIAFVVELRQVCSVVPASKFSKVHMLSHPVISVCCTAEVV